MDEELDLKEIVKCIYQRKNLLIYILIASLLIGIIYTFIIKQPIYEINSKILIDKADASIGEFVISKDILENENINVEFDKTTKVITLSISTSKDELEKSLNDVNTYIENLKTKLEEIYSIKSYDIIETPKIPEEANNISYFKDIEISIIIGLVIYFIYIMLMISLRGVTNGYEIERKLNIKFLGMLDLAKRKNKKEVSYNIEDKIMIEQLKRIQANLELNKENKQPKTILVTGTKKGVGTSFVTKNLAGQYTKLYEKVLIIDANIMNKTLTNILLRKEEKGLTDIIAKDERQEEIEKYINKTNNQKLFILPNGTITIEEEMFLKGYISKILDELKKKYDIVLIDSTSINESILPIALTNIVDSTIIVIEREKTKEEEVIKAKTTIENAGGKISGLILNKMI